ncbi:hypothetical protein ACH5RR_022010 [Cinchona calisaya]|uniref:Mei2-like C-terminal RNA recognition motif domain-containing protein n=1 Tax=Cinchona calisaya TaxID=153742 RepID=A0ABD2Z7N5_9GENT
MAAPPRHHHLNPQAAEYTPLFSASTINNSHLNNPPFINLISFSSIPSPPAFPTSSTPFLHLYHPPLHLPPYSIRNEPFYLPQKSTHFPLLLPPPPPQEDVDDVPQPSPLSVSSRIEPVKGRPKVITHKNHHRFGRGRGSSWEWARRGCGSCSSMHEERRGDQSIRIYVEKHGILPLRRCEEKTTVMIKNIPNEFTRWMLVEFMDKHCMLENQKTKLQQGVESAELAQENPLSAYDFVYLPIDFRTQKNKGYAFVNFTQPQAVWKFFKACDSTKWDFKDSPKFKKIVCASIQGKEALVRHFEKTDFECESDEFLPLFFSPPRDGSGDSVGVTPIGNVVGRSLIASFGRRPHQTKHRILV